MTKTTKNKTWCLIQFLAEWESTDFKSMIYEIFKSVHSGAVFSPATKNLYIQQERIEVFDSIVENYRSKVAKIYGGDDSAAEDLDNLFNE